MLRTVLFFVPKSASKYSEKNEYFYYQIVVRKKKTWKISYHHSLF